MRSRWRAPLITLAVIVVAVAGGTHFLATGSLRDALIAIHGGHRGGGGGALAGLHGGGKAPSGTPAADAARVPIGVRLELTGKAHDTIRVADVTVDAIAAEAGLMKDDVIASLDGKPAAGLTVEQVTEILERPAGCTVGVLRGAQNIAVALPSRTGG